MAERDELTRLLDVARHKGGVEAVQALADAVRVQARSDSGRAAAGALPGLLGALVGALKDADLSCAWASTSGDLDKTAIPKVPHAASTELTT